MTTRRRERSWAHARALERILRQRLGESLGHWSYGGLALLAVVLTELAHDVASELARREQVLPLQVESR